MRLIVIALLAVMLAACGAPAAYVPPPAPQAAAPVAAQPGYDWTVARSQDILVGYGLAYHETDYRGQDDCGAQACLGYFKGAAPNIIHIQLFVEDNRLQGIVAGAWGDPADSLLQDLGYAAYDILAGPLGASDVAVDCAIALDVGEMNTCDGILMSTELVEDGDGWMSMYRNMSR